MFLWKDFGFVKSVFQNIYSFSIPKFCFSFPLFLANDVRTMFAFLKVFRLKSTKLKLCPSLKTAAVIYLRKYKTDTCMFLFRFFCKVKEFVNNYLKGVQIIVGPLLNNLFGSIPFYAMVLLI